MLQSIVAKDGLTMIPDEVRVALHIEPGTKLEYELGGDHVTVRVLGDAAALSGVLASDKGKGLSFAEIRAAAAEERCREMRNE